jgi:hypothetical protein
MAGQETENVRFRERSIVIPGEFTLNLAVWTPDFDGGAIASIGG